MLATGARRDPIQALRFARFSRIHATTIGTIAHLRNPSLKSIRDYYHKYYVPNNMAIIMTGDLDPDVLSRLADRQIVPQA